MKSIVRSVLICTLGIGCLLAANPAFATVAIAIPYGVDLSATETGSGGGTNYSNYGPGDTSGSIPSDRSPTWTGSVNILTGQISAGSVNQNSEAINEGYQTFVEGWNTWTFHGPTGSTINTSFDMTGNFSQTSGLSFSSLGSTSPGTGQVCLGLSIGGCNENSQYSSNVSNFSVDLALNGISNNESVLVSYSLTTTAPAYGSSAIFDPSTGFGPLPPGWTVTGAAGGLAAAPEPSSISLFGSGILLIGFLAFRKKMEHTIYNT